MTEAHDILRTSWRSILSTGETFPRVFYEVLFDIAPEAKALFPVDMRAQRLKLMKTLAAVVHSAHDLELAVPRLRQLGADHVRYGAGPEHYPAVGAALLFTAQWLPVPGWNPEQAEAWATAYGAVSAVMIEAAAKVPPPVEARILRVERGDPLTVWTPAAGALPAGPLLHVTRSDRVGEWLAGLRCEVHGEPAIRIDTPDTPAGWGMANLPVGDSAVRLRLAPVYEETEHA